MMADETTPGGFLPDPMNRSSRDLLGAHRV